MILSPLAGFLFRWPVVEVFSLFSIAMLQRLPVFLASMSCSTSLDGTGRKLLPRVHGVLGVRFLGSFSFQCRGCSVRPQSRVFFPFPLSFDEL